MIDASFHSTTSSEHCPGYGVVLLSGLSTRTAGRIAGENEEVHRAMNLGVQILDQGRLDEAEPLMEKALADFLHVFGNKHPGTLSAANNLGSLRLTQKRFPEAEKLYRDTMRLSIEVLSDQHPKTLQTINNLAVVLKHQGKFDEIEGLFRSVVASLKKSQSEKNPWLPVSLDNLASELERQGRWDEATPYLNDAFQAQQRLTGINSKATLRALETLGWNLSKCKKWKEAEAHYHTLISLQKNVLGPSSPELLVSRERLAWVYMAQMKWSEAESLLRDWLQHCVKLNPPWWKYSYITLLLGKCILNQKRYEEAEKYLLTGVQELRVHGPVLHEDIDSKSADGMACLIQLYTETNKPEEVKKWQAEKAKLLKTSVPAVK